jgi:hypothetical protein
MNQIDQLIESLAQETRPVTPMRSPAALLVRLGAVLLLYAFVTGYVLGLRPDLAMQLQRPFYLAEIILLAILSFSSLWACVHLAFPDPYQRRIVTQLPILAFGILSIILGIQGFLPHDVRMVIPPPETAHGMECTLCIGSVAIIPSALMLIFLRRGASVHPRAAGAYAVLAAAGIGCLMLRLSEANDSLAHLITWHYLPTLLFAVIGAGIGKWLLKW